MVRGGVGAAIASYLFESDDIGGIHFVKDPESRIAWIATGGDGAFVQRLEIESRKGAWHYWASVGYRPAHDLDPWVYMSLVLPEMGTNGGPAGEPWRRVRRRLSRAWSKLNSETEMLAQAETYGKSAREWDSTRTFESSIGPWALIRLIGRARGGVTVDWPIVDAEMSAVSRAFFPTSVLRASRMNENFMSASSVSHFQYQIAKTALLLRDDPALWRA